MSDWTGLKIRIDKFLDGDEITAGAPVVIRRMDAAAPSRAMRHRPETIVAAPVGSYTFTAVPLPAGRYEVEATLPSGEQLTEAAVVRPGEAVEVTLRGEYSPNEWRSWSNFGGSRKPSLAEQTSETYRTDFEAPDFPYLLSLGQRGADRGTGQALNLGSWEDWYLWLGRRSTLALEGGEAAWDLELRSGEAELQYKMVGGSGQSPAMLQIRNTQPVYYVQHLGADRFFASIANAKGARVFSLPWPWPAGERPDQPFFEIMVAEREDALVCDPVMRDPKLGGLIAYLNAGRVGLAGQLLEAAHLALFAKYDNPLGAAAGGYVLLSTSASEGLESWPEWLDNLARNFPELPDGPILRARWLLDHRSDPEGLHQAHDLLVTAFERGLPYFSAGVVWLIEGLRRTSIECPVCQEILRTVRGVARFMDLSQAFTSFDLRAPKSPVARGPWQSLSPTPNWMPIGLSLQVPWLLAPQMIGR